ncbi:cell wall hydrolase [Alicyclobacillus sp. SO9]|uniref:cell wall hydrolase n=1 Tax=Alicyclobacillus sp. SO9 TaxID=2665646 RepID=UPI0018E74F8A|nr:cell wall hydrolase [Alicyclobacillus sp. SO9]QQE77139.1 cell wall hydrolase [Alicyclobacillus sp. SO9]
MKRLFTTILVIAIVGACVSYYSNDQSSAKTLSGTDKIRPITSMLHTDTGSNRLSSRDLLLIEAFIAHHAASQPFKAQVAIASVVLHRLHSAKFPNSVETVIANFEKQGLPSTDQENSTENSFQAHAAVLDAVHGWDPSKGALYCFPRQFSHNGLTHTVTIGNLAFYQ